MRGSCGPGGGASGPSIQIFLLAIFSVLTIIAATVHSAPRLASNRWLATTRPSAAGVQPWRLGSTASDAAVLLLDRRQWLWRNPSRISARIMPHFVKVNLEHAAARQGTAVGKR